MVRDDLRLYPGALEMACLHRPCDTLVQLPPLVAEQACVRRIMHEGMLEHVGLAARFAAFDHESGGRKRGQGSAQRVRIQRRKYGKQVAREFVTNDGTQLCNFAGRAQLVEARHQRVLKRRRDLRPPSLLEDRATAHGRGRGERSRQLFDVQRHAVGPEDDLVDPSRGKPLARRELPDHGRGLFAIEALETQRADVRQARPRMLDRGSRGDEHEDRQVLYPMDEQV